MEIGRHWNDGVNLGARARFENNDAAPARAPSILWIDDLREEDRGAYRCRVDFRQAPTRNARINLEVIGERASERVALQSRNQYENNAREFLKSFFFFPVKF